MKTRNIPISLHPLVYPPYTKKTYRLIHPTRALQRTPTSYPNLCHNLVHMCMTLRQCDLSASPSRRVWGCSWGMVLQEAAFLASSGDGLSNLGAGICGATAIFCESMDRHSSSDNPDFGHIFGPRRGTIGSLSVGLVPSRGL
jgi:hypothetical protein